MFDFVLDSHCDTPSMLLEGLDLTQHPVRGHVDFHRMRQGGVDGAFFALYTSNSLTQEQALDRANKMLAACQQTIAEGERAGMAAFAGSVAQALENRSRGLCSVFIGMENGLPIGEDLDLLRDFYRRGVRYLTLTHNGNNAICDSAAQAVQGKARWNGLSPFGREVVLEMNRLGMIIDVSHVSDATFEQVVDFSVAPIVATHSCCRALCHHPRNMTDDMIRRLAKKGGVIQINFYPAFLEEEFGQDPAFLAADAQAEELQSRYRNAIGAGTGPSAAHLYDEKGLQELEAAYNAAMAALMRFPAPSYTRVVDHIEHVIRLVGPEHVGLGSDFDGISVAPDGLRDMADYGVIRAELQRRGHSEKDIRGILGGNFLRVMRDVEQCAGSSACPAGN